MININLLPKEFIAKQRFKELVTLITLCSIILVIFLGMIYITRTITLAQLVAELNKVETELKQLEPIVKEVEEHNKLKMKLEGRKNLVIYLMSQGVVYPKFMSQLLRTLPDGVWITNMNTNTIIEPTGDKKIAGVRVRLSCSSYDKISIADFLSNLENFGQFKDIKLGPINISQQDKYELHNFSVEFIYTAQ
ncbi:MAG: PilN domain-containing protein [Elusimicrobiota bacterium]|nr:PilN domain-containing protein [Elusimicrobiota bacterium]